MFGRRRSSLISQKKIRRAETGNIVSATEEKADKGKLSVGNFFSLSLFDLLLWIFLVYIPGLYSRLLRWFVRGPGV